VNSLKKNLYAIKFSDSDHIAYGGYQGGESHICVSEEGDRCHR